MPRNHVDGGLLTSHATSVVLGIDPSLTGFAMTALDPESGRFESWVYKSENRGIDRLADIMNWIKEKVELLTTSGFTIADAGIEDTVVASYSSVAMGELAATVKFALLGLLAAPAKYPLKVPPTMVKKYATGKGNAKKNEVILSVYKKWGVEYTDDNMADSYVIARIASGTPSTVYEGEVQAKLAAGTFRDGKPV